MLHPRADRSAIFNRNVLSIEFVLFIGVLTGLFKSDTSLSFSGAGRCVKVLAAHLNAPFEGSGW